MNNSFLTSQHVFCLLGNRGLTSNWNSTSCYGFFGSSVKGILVLPRCDDTFMNIWLTEIVIHSSSSNLLFNVRHALYRLQTDLTYCTLHANHHSTVTLQPSAAITRQHFIAFCYCTIIYCTLYYWNKNRVECNAVRCGVIRCNNLRCELSHDSL